MSGIAGIITMDGSPADLSLITRLTDAMRHRGPDGVVHWAEGSAALGHCMLRATPESMQESQPLVDQKNGLVVVFDGRLDNRDELLASIRSSHLSLMAPDPVFVLEAFLKWGRECPVFLLGDFAFAVWDIQSRRLFCARDRMGAGSLAFVQHPDGFAFASEAEALLNLPGVQFEPNEKFIAGMFMPGVKNLEERSTWIKSVHTLHAGESLLVDKEGKAEFKQYWSLEPGEYNRYVSLEESNEHFLEVFGEAVRCRMRADGDVGIMMSGGLDSAAIVAMVRRLSASSSRGRVESYSMVGDNGDDPETRCIHELAARSGFDANYLSVPSMTGEFSMEDLMKVAWSKPHPVDGSILLPELMNLAASRNGHKVMLCGASGDVCQSAGQSYIAQWLKSGKYRMAWRESTAASRHHVGLAGNSALEIFLRNAGRAFMPQVVGRMLRGIRNRTDPSGPVHGSPVSPDFARRIRSDDEGLNDAIAAETGPGKPSRAFLAGNNCLLVMSSLSGFGKVAAKHGIESRDPWADPRVLKFFLDLPLEFKVRNGWTKAQVRTALSNDLGPLVTRRRDKLHLGGILAKQLMIESRELVCQVLSDEQSRLRPYVDLDEVELIKNRYLKGEENSVFWLYTVVSLALWLKRLESI